ncbi:MAG: EamA family transporter [Candidatus Micrarchaeota archaeon]
MDYAWLIFAILSALAAAFVAIFGKMGLQGMDTTTATTIRAAIMAVLLFGVIVFEGKLNLVGKILSNSEAFKYIALSGIAGALSWLFYFLALKTGKVSQVLPIDRLSVVFGLVLAVLVLGERVNLQIAAGAVLMVVGAVLVALG